MASLPKAFNFFDPSTFFWNWHTTAHYYIREQGLILPINFFLKLTHYCALLYKRAGSHLFYSRTQPLHFSQKTQFIIFTFTHTHPHPPPPQPCTFVSGAMFHLTRKREIGSIGSVQSAFVMENRYPFLLKLHIFLSVFYFFIPSFVLLFSSF
jgi:hypothetical protein